jgi:hypothetical protein
LKLQEPNCVASSWSAGLDPLGPGVVSRSVSAGLLAPMSLMTPFTMPVSTAAGTPQIVTRRQGPWASAVENRDVPLWAAQASQ